MSGKRLRRLPDVEPASPVIRVVRGGLVRPPHQLNHHVFCLSAPHCPVCMETTATGKLCSLASPRPPPPPRTPATLTQGVMCWGMRSRVNDTRWPNGGSEVARRRPAAGPVSNIGWDESCTSSSHPGDGGRRTSVPSPWPEGSPLQIVGTAGTGQVARGRPCWLGRVTGSPAASSHVAGFPSGGQPTLYLRCQTSPD